MTRAAVLVVALALGSVARAEPSRPAQLRGVGVDERVGERIPLGLMFTDTSGRRVALATLFGDGRPVVLVLTYVRCKTLCSLVLHGVIDAVRALPLELGRDYRVVFVSIDPNETSADAEARRHEIVARLERGAESFVYLVGAERTIRALADSLGFRYKVDARTEQIAHPAVIFVLTPDGRISRYLHGVQFATNELAGALRAAANGDVLSATVAASVLDCFRFDPALRAHRELIENYLRVGGSVVMLALGSTVALLFMWERRRRRSS
jgi:protein SCO1/2